MATKNKDERLENSIDVIVQYTKDGKLIPMRIKIQDEDGMYQTYSIRQFREKTLGGEYTLPNGVEVSNNKNRHFDIKIITFGVEKTISIFFDGSKWFLR